MKHLILIIILFMTSCSLTNNMSNAEYMRKAKIQKEIDILQANYYYQLDSLHVEYYKKNK